MRPFSWHEVWVPEWPPVEVIFRALIVYLFIQILFRLSGRKEWTRYSAFNVTVLFLIAVALRTTMVGTDHSLTSGLIAITTLIATDWLLSYLSFRSERIADFLQGKVFYLIQGGTIQKGALRKARVSESRLLEQVRLKGHQSLDEVKEARLERSGHISILFKSAPSLHPTQPSPGQAA